MIGSLLLIGLLTAPQGPGRANGNGAEPGLNNRLPSSVLRLPEGSHAIVVEKSTQTLALFGGSPSGSPALLHILRTNTGEKDGDKETEGDLKTPEGIYFFQGMIPGATLPAEYGLRAFTTDFPNVFDRLQGKNGSNIWLHATDDPNRVEGGRNTRGCVVVTNQSIELLSDVIRMTPGAGATPLIIEEHFTLLTPAELERTSNDMMEIIRGWEEAWELRDTDRYMSYYDPAFAGMGRDFASHRAYKDRLNRQYRFIDIEISNLHLFAHDSEMVATFDQLYASDRYRAESTKKLYFRRRNGEWKIVRETGYIIHAGAVTTPPPEPVEQAVPVPEPAAPDPEPERPAPVEVGDADLARVTDLVRDWARSWESQDIDRYMAFYAADFSGGGRTRAQHRAHKARLARSYEWITVGISELEVTVEAGQIVAVFEQTYSSDRYSDTTVKRLVFVREGGEWKIISEEVTGRL